MQIDDGVEAFLFQIWKQVVVDSVIVNEMYGIDVRVIPHNIFESPFSQKMNFRIRVLLLQAAYDRRGKYDVADGRETEEEKLHGAKVRISYEPCPCFSGEIRGSFFSPQEHEAHEIHEGFYH